MIISNSAFCLSYLFMCKECFSVARLRHGFVLFVRWELGLSKVPITTPSCSKSWSWSDLALASRRLAKSINRIKKLPFRKVLNGGEPGYPWPDNSFNCFNGLETKRFTVKGIHRPAWLLSFVASLACSDLSCFFFIVCLYKTLLHDKLQAVNGSF